MATEKTNVAIIKVTRDSNGTTFYLKSEILNNLLRNFANGAKNEYYLSDDTRKVVWYYRRFAPNYLHNYTGDMYYLLNSTSLNEGVELKLSYPTTVQWCKDMVERMRKDIESIISEYCQVYSTEVTITTNAPVIRFDVPNP